MKQKPEKAWDKTIKEIIENFVKHQKDFNRKLENLVRNLKEPKKDKP